MVAETGSGEKNHEADEVSAELPYCEYLGYLTRQLDRIDTLIAIR